MSETANQPRLIVWGAGTARTLRVHWALRELGLSYETQPIVARTGETRTPEYRQINPKEKIPTLQDGGLTLTESAAIVTYLAQKYGESIGLIPPAASPERAAYYEWSFFTMMEIDALALYVLRRHSALTQVYGEAPNAVQAAREAFEKQIKIVDQKLALHGPFILGATFTGADILLTSCLLWADRYALPLPETLIKYRQLTTSRAAHRVAVEVNRWP
jgi:glutathione S-transferase